MQKPTERHKLTSAQTTKKLNVKSQFMTPLKVAKDGLKHQV